jgi:hypothetical protein
MSSRTLALAAALLPRFPLAAPSATSCPSLYSCLILAERLRSSPRIAYWFRPTRFKCPLPADSVGESPLGIDFRCRARAAEGHPSIREYRNVPSGRSRAPLGIFGVAARRRPKAARPPREFANIAMSQVVVRDTSLGVFDGRRARAAEGRPTTPRVCEYRAVPCCRSRDTP